MGKPFCKLADPKTYVACPDWRLDTDEPARNYWVPFFIEHSKTILKLGIEAAVALGEDQSSAQARAAACHEKFAAVFNAFLKNPRSRGPVSMLTIDAWRDQLLREFGFHDAFIDLKNRENEKMLPLLPAVCSELDALPEPQRLRAAIEGVFAGNIFDMGAAATAKAFLGASPDFFNIRQSVSGRPWLVNNFEMLNRVWHESHYAKVVLFIDNAGSDFLLGALPLGRWLAQRGTRVVIAANELPTLNDMSVHDVRAWWPRILNAEPSLGDLSFEIVSTGTAEPLIDLANVSDELNRASADADLVILEGMGRAVESNFTAAFSCDALKIAMIKVPIVAERLGGKLYDVVCKFQRSA
jgi:uncharacterized protein with ATP-grasp and redox domains